MPDGIEDHRGTPSEFRCFFITMKQVTDDRGTVREFYRQSAWEAAGLPGMGAFLQVNITESRRGVVRGLHGETMTKVVAVAWRGVRRLRRCACRISDLGAVVTLALTAGTQVLVPNGVCNGFQTTSDLTQYLYCFDTEWQPGMTGVAVNPTGPALGIEWPLPPVLSEKDAAASAFGNDT